MLCRTESEELPDFSPHEDVDAAEKLLKETNKSLEQIAFETGFTSSASFRAIYARVKGETTLETRLKAKFELAMKRLENWDDPIDAIAADLGFSSGEVFSQTFEKLTGQTAYNYRGHDVFIRLSRKMLGNRTIPLEKIAARFGYKDASTFSQAFKNLTGEPPTAYRERANKGKLSPRLERARMLIETTDLSFEEIAADPEVNYGSAGHLGVCFKEATWFTMTEYREITRTRGKINEARKLLDTTNLQMKDIAEKVGFNTSSTLVVAFQRQMEQTPDEYRKYNRIMKAKHLLATTQMLIADVAAEVLYDLNSFRGIFREAMGVEPGIYRDLMQPDIRAVKALGLFRFTDKTPEEVFPEAGYNSIYTLKGDFKAKTGETPAACYKRMLLRRIEDSKELLEAGKTVEEIFAEVGFRSPEAFTETFLRETDLMPEAYRQNFTSFSLRHD